MCVQLLPPVKILTRYENNPRGITAGKMASRARYRSGRMGLAKCTQYMRVCSVCMCVAKSGRKIETTDAFVQKLLPPPDIRACKCVRYEIVMPAAELGFNMSVFEFNCPQVNDRRTG